MNSKGVESKGMLPLRIILALKHFCHGASTCALPFVFACEILTERGFALAIFFYFVADGCIIISFSFLIFLNEDPSKLISVIYAGIFAVVSCAVFLI